jgi:sulfite exporter TauE/SafE
MGLVAGLVGGGIGFMVGQQYLSIFTGVLLLLGLLVSWAGSGKFYLPISKLLIQLKSKMSQILTGQPSQQWLFGIYNGLLPCGLTYVALAAAISTGNLFEGIMYMVLFGIGTGPMMWLIASGINKLKLKTGYGGKIITGFTMMLAFLLIIRGLGLGIPYLSPDTDHHHDTHLMKGH